MKKKLLNVAFAVTMLFMTSCNGVFYQVYTVQSDSLKQQDNSLVFENDDCKVFYNLWSNSGDVSFAFVNKTDKDVFINMGQTFFIVNGKAKDYYQERTFGLHDFTQYSAEVGTGQITLETNGYWGSEKYYENMQAINNAMKVKKSVSTTNSVTIKEKEIICIPANSYKILCKCSVNPVVLQTCIKNKDFPNRNTNVGSYDKKTTPLVFKNIAVR